jgi:hypothetical protein
MIPREFDPFVRHVHRDGTTDSICKYCFVTVCTSTWETELEHAERDHVCDPDTISRWKRMQQPVSD